ncbi:MAG: ATP-binding protein [Dehalococcoidales bacterium]|jgi:AAA+ superfamily predicted ATPase
MEEKVYDDKGYLDEIFAIYQPLLEKEAKADKTEIKQKEKTFWEKIRQGKENGGEFLIEKVADHYGLNSFEKRVLLLFLCLEFSPSSKSSMSVNEVLDILDYGGSFTGRLRNTAYFHPDKALLGKGVLDVPEGYLTRDKYFKISSSVVDLVSRAIDGSEIEWKDAEPEKEEADKKSKKSNTKTETLGIVKYPSYNLSSVIIKDEARDDLFLFLEGYNNSGLENLGISQTVKKGRGLTLLFYGPPGTGKSMLAEAVAAYVKKRMLVVDASKVRARYYGDTEKKIAAIFKSAAEEDLMILLDEADTFLYDRSFAREEHDIMFVNVMLNELERFEGIIIMTTNMDCLLDGAVERRIALKVKFELPDAEMREHIWKTHIPDKIKVAEGVDFAALAGRYEFSGGNIKNAFLNSARKLAQRSTNIITMEDLIFGAELERKGMFSAKNRSKKMLGFRAN